MSTMAPPSTIRVLVADDHPAMAAGLVSVLSAESGLEAVGVASDELELWPALRRTKPDVLILDHHLPGTTGLALCHRLKSEPLAPAVLIYSAYLDQRLALGAMVAGADGVLHKGATARELVELIRVLAGGDRALPALHDVREAAAEVATKDWPILAMLSEGTPRAEIADVLGVDTRTVRHRCEQILGQLSARCAPGAA